MKSIRRFLAIFLAASVALSAAGCSKDSGAQPVVTTSTAATSTDSTTQSEPDSTTTQGQSTTTGTSTDVQHNEPADDIEIVSPDGAGLTATFSISSTWEDGGMKCSQLDFTVTNNTGADLNGWTLDIDLGQNIEIVQSWNVTLSANGTRLTASNVDYNAQLTNGSQTPFGCILKTASEIGNATVDGAGTPAQTTTVATTTSQSTAAQSTSAPPVAEDPAPAGAQGLVSEHGQLSVNGADLVDENGARMQLRGVSTHGIQWFPQFANKEAFRHLRDEWGINTIRLAMYSGASEGYTDSTKAGIEKTVQDAVDACIELDMYVIIDWHVLADQSPQVRKADALRFFGYMSERYAKYPNVIYEICNEPNGYASWGSDIKPYAEEVIPVIRANDPDSVIIVGTPTWSQDIDKALADPLKYDNIMYALHYYAATHTDWLRDRLKNCYNSGMAIFVSEFGNCDASGGGANNFDQATKWLDMLENLNISYMTWALSDKNETCSLLVPGAPANGGWSDAQLSENGKFMKNWFLNH